MFKSIVVVTLFLSIHFMSLAQTATVYGIVTDEKGKPKSQVNVVLFGQPGEGISSNKEGAYLVEVPSTDTVVLVFSHIGYKQIYKKVVAALQDTFRLNIQLELQTDTLGQVVVTDKGQRQQFIQSIPLAQLEYIPDPTGDPLIAILKKYVVSNNELSSQYSVRGGNYDENLVYVNGFEIYRSLLVRSGQQEGLAFPNYDLISNIKFSAGGFEAKYGDKLSSVLDIQYKKPKAFEAGVSASFLGASFYMNDGSDTQKVYYLFGARYKTNQYLLNSLNTEGQYKPVFGDVQGLIGINVNRKSTFEILGNYSYNQYQFIPQSSSTSTGVVNNVIRLDVFFDGQETDAFNTGMGGVSYQYRPNDITGLKFLASAYHSLESETFDIIGDYWLGAVETNLGDEDFGDIKYALGVGTFQNFARNYLEATVANIGHDGYAKRGNHYFEWGARAQYETINDELKEWEMLDSAGFSLPYNGEQVQLHEVFRSAVDLNSMRYNAYVEDSWSPDRNADNKTDFTLTGGLRSSYWDVNKELTVSPRVNIAFKPQWLRADSTPTDIIFKAAIGMYAQPPFYRELKDLQGNVHTDVKSQKSIHFLVGADYNFHAWNRDFNFVTELYYKYLYDLIPYDIDNVRIRYYGTNDATGYAAGVDFRLNGQIVKDADSWISLSILQTRENLVGDSTYNTDGELVAQGFIPRPTDQFLNFGMFFQDYLPQNKNFKVHLNFLLGTGLPFGPPDNKYYRDAFRIPPYRRVDIGFSALLLSNDRDRKKTNSFSHIKSLWVSLEVFNLLGVQNTISYTWVKDVTNTEYAFPNYLTDRRINLKLTMKI